MKKALLFISSLALISGWLGCTQHTNPKTESSTKTGRKITSALDAKAAGLSIDFVTIKAGSFQMGSHASEANRKDDEDLHIVTISKDFSIQATVVTQKQYFLVMGHNPSYFKFRSDCSNDYVEINKTALCPNNPVENVSWTDTQDFIAKLNAFDSNYSYRLPTEAEWEFSTRGGTQTMYWYGNEVDKLSDYAWFDENSKNQTHAVKSKPANQYGLYDAHGNVWQWVQDWYKISLGSLHQNDPVGAASGPFRVVRGGSWSFNAPHLRAAGRGLDFPTDRSNDVGFRLVRTAK